MARYGCTITVATGKVPSAQTDFTWVAVTANFPSAAIDGGSTSINNGGGNLRCYTDSGKGTRLPLEVGKFVTGGSPDIIIWGTSSSLNVGDTVYIEADTVATSLPADGAAFGRDACNAEFSNVYNLEEAVAGPFVDSTGNTNATATNSSKLTSVAAANTALGEGIDFDATTGSSIKASASIAAYPYTLSAWVKIEAFNSGTIVGVATSNADNKLQGMRVGTSNKIQLYSLAASGFTSASSTSSYSVGDVVFVEAAFRSSTDAELYVDGASEATLNSGHAYPLSPRNLGLAVIPRLNPVGLNNCEIYRATTRTFAVTAAQSDSSYSNQNDPASFWTTSAWEDQDAGLTISPPSIASTEAFGTAEITTGSVTLSPSGIASLEAFGTAEVTTGVEVVSPSSIASEESVPTPEITTGVVTLSPSGITSQESVPSPTVESLGVILTPLSIASLEAFGNAVVERLLAILSPLGITSAESFGLVTVVGGDTLIIPVDERQTWNRVAKYLRTVGFKGSDNDVIVAWLRSEGLLEGAYNDMWNEYLLNNGYFALTLTDKYAAWRQNVITAAFNSSGVLICGGTIQCSEIIPCGE
jgi:hypothetical protein